MLTDFNTDIDNDVAFAQIQISTLYAIFAKNKKRLLPTQVFSCVHLIEQHSTGKGCQLLIYICYRVPQERINFSPHPKTLTMAGDYEYFAAQASVNCQAACLFTPAQEHCRYPCCVCIRQGHHPFAYALAELIDNSLRATRHATQPNQSRTITISFVTKGTANNPKGLISVQDNGSGMTKQALNEWAIMNLSMEDRGLQAVEPETAVRGQQTAPGAANFLTGDLSQFGASAWQSVLTLEYAWTAARVLVDFAWQRPV